MIRLSPPHLLTTLTTKAKVMPVSRGTSYILYDLPGNATKHQAWSPNVWKTRWVIFMTSTVTPSGDEPTGATPAGSCSTTRAYRIRRSG